MIIFREYFENFTNNLIFFIKFIPLLLAISIFIWIFEYLNYGFDFTDEGYYIVWIANPFEYKASASQFGFIYHPLYLLVGEDLVYLRKLDMVITVFLSLILSYLVINKILPKNKIGWLKSIFFTTGISINVFLNYNISTPNYNSLTLQGLMIVLIGLLIIESKINKNILIGSFILGIGGYLTFMAKPISAIIISFFLLFYILLRRKHFYFILFTSILTSLVFLLVSAIIIDDNIIKFYERLLLGIEFRRILGAQYSIFEILRIDLPPVDLQNFISTLLTFIISFLIIFIMYKNINFRNLYIILISFLIFFLILFIIYEIFNINFNIGKFQKLQLFGVIIASILSLILFNKNKFNFNDPKLRIAFIFFLLPFIYAVGSNSNYWVQGSQAGIFWIIFSILILAYFISNNRLINILSPLLLICQLITVIHLNNKFENPYRQPQPLRLNNSYVEILQDKTKIYLSNDYARYISDAKNIASKNNFESNSPIIDLSGQSPGLIYSLRGTNLGLAWISGGYSGSLDHAILAFELISCEKISKAWVLEEVNGNRKIPNKLLSSFGLKLSDYEFVGSLETNIRPSPWKSNIKTSKIQKFYKPHNKNQLLQSCKEKRRK